MKFRLLILNLILIQSACFKGEPCPDCMAPPSLTFSILDAENRNDLIYNGTFSPDTITLYYTLREEKHYIEMEVEEDSVFHRARITSLEILDRSVSGIHNFYLYLEKSDTDTLYLETGTTRSCCPAFIVDSFLINQQNLYPDSLGQAFLYLK